MSLASGTRLGPYEVLTPLGAGGTGEVYKARDTRLDCTVAVKILPVHLSSDATLRQRFDQEAKAISSLNHPLVYVPGGAQTDQRRLVWVNRNGMEQPVAAAARAYLFPRLSPDGSRVAAGIAGQDTQIWLYDLSRETLTRLTFEGNVNLNAVWTPDGKRVAFKELKRRVPPGKN